MKKKMESLVMKNDDDEELMNIVDFMGRQVLELCSKDYAINRYFLEILKQKEEWLMKEENDVIPLEEFICNSNSMKKLRSFNFDIEELPSGDFLKNNVPIEGLSEILGFDVDFLEMDDMPPAVLIKSDNYNNK